MTPKWGQTRWTCLQAQLAFEGPGQGCGRGPAGCPLPPSSQLFQDLQLPWLQRHPGSQARGVGAWALVVSVSPPTTALRGPVSSPGQDMLGFLPALQALWSARQPQQVSWVWVLAGPRAQRREHPLPPQGLPGPLPPPAVPQAGAGLA